MPTPELRPRRSHRHLNSLVCGDFALAQLSDGSFIVGSAPFLSSAEPATEGVSFYVNDFTLSESRPWRIPHQWAKFDSINELPVHDPQSPGMDWEEPDFTAFATVFKSLKEELKRGELVKTVPVVSARCRISDSTHLAQMLVSAAVPADESSSMYAFQDNGNGFAGLTPERLFRIDGKTLQAMALAGTSPSGSSESFAHDAKEKYEHRLVVETLRDRLAGFGEVIEGDREIIDVGGMVHFLTRFHVILDASPVINEVIKTLHPTPAVGVVPGNSKFMQALCEQRTLSGIPVAFGAPFGVKVEECFESFVLIRGVFWDRGNAFLPSGCGIVSESQLQSEWRELTLKRNWVKQAFSLV
jgi:menaquinone-specific isochorismate synthase